MQGWLRVFAVIIQSLSRAEDLRGSSRSFLNVARQSTFAFHNLAVKPSKKRVGGNRFHSKEYSSLGQRAFAAIMQPLSGRCQS